MKIALILAFLFYIGSSIGWILEIFYRRFVSTKKWINPGFLTGPYLPIYGIGLCMLFLLSLADLSFIDNKIIKNIVTISFMGIAMTLIEYIAGIIFIKGMNVKLWDYSDRLGNIKGIICPLYSLFWCVLGAVYYFFIQQHMLHAVSWLFENLAYCFVIGFFFGILTIDVGNSINIIVRVRKFAKDNNILVKFEELKKHIREDQEKRKEKISYLFAFKTTRKLVDLLGEYQAKYLKKK